MARLPPQGRYDILADVGNVKGLSQTPPNISVGRPDPYAEDYAAILASMSAPPTKIPVGEVREAHVANREDLPGLSVTEYEVAPSKPPTARSGAKPPQPRP